MFYGHANKAQVLLLLLPAYQARKGDVHVLNNSSFGVSRIYEISSGSTCNFCEILTAQGPFLLI